VGERSTSPGFFRMSLNMDFDLSGMIVVIAQCIVDLSDRQMRIGVEDTFNGPVVTVLADHMAHGDTRAPNVRLDPGRSVTLDNVGVLGLNFRSHHSPSTIPIRNLQATHQSWRGTAM